jgi:hypothetical protein
MHGLGEYKMKKLALLFPIVGLIMLGIAVSPSFAGTSYGVALSTFPVNGSVADLGSPMKTGSISIVGLTLSNSGATAQTVTFYKNATSTTAVTAVFSVTLPAAAGFYLPVGELNTYNLINLTNFTCRKSSTSTDVNLYINYK